MLEELDKETEKLIALYKKSYVYLLKELLREVDKGLSINHTATMLLRVRDELKELDEEAYKYCNEVLPQYYFVGVNAVEAQVAITTVATINGFNNILHKKAIERASTDTFKDLAARTKFMEDQLKEIIRDTSKEIFSRQLVTGESRKTILKQLKQELKAKGITSFVDAGNKRWTIDNYSEMLLRTKPRILINEGTVDRLKVYQEKYPDSSDFDLIQLSSHGAKDWCRLYEGKVFSISGNHPNYPPVSSLPNGYATLHPRCRHIFQPYIESIRGKGKAVDQQYLNKSIKELNIWDYHERKKAQG
jgi:hypothetical protein